MASRAVKRFLAEVISPIQNKVGQLLMAAPIRNVLGQVRSRLDPEFIMDEGRIFIGNLSKGRLGEDKSRLLGALLVTQFQHAAMSRSRVPESERRDFHLYIDEFHNFTTETFAGILSECRKYRLTLTLSHQYMGQLIPKIRDAIFGNVGTMISFRVGEADAMILQREYGRTTDADQFTDLANHQVLVKLLEDGRHPSPFHGRTLPPTGKRYGRRAQIVRFSRERHARPRARVENRIKRWMES